MGLAIAVFLLLLWYIGTGRLTTRAQRDVEVVLSFSGKEDGWPFAKRIKEELMTLCGWTSLAVYLDADSLIGKPGTKETTLGARGGTDDTTTIQLAPEWATYYRAALDEAPAGVFLLSRGWCASPYCTEELTWYLALRCGLEPVDTSPQQLIDIIARPWGATTTTRHTGGSAQHAARLASWCREGEARGVPPGAGRGRHAVCLSAPKETFHCTRAWALFAGCCVMVMACALCVCTRVHVCVPVYACVRAQASAPPSVWQVSL